MKTTTICVALALTLAACDDGTAPPVKSTGKAGIRTMCLNGHEYYLKEHGLTNRLNDDGTPYKCGE